MPPQNDSYLFHRDGELFSPQAAAGSPWSVTMQHGGPVNAIIALSVESCAKEIGMEISRLTFDILKPVPMEPIKVVSRFIRKGRRTAVLDTYLTVEGSDEPVASGRAVLLKPIVGKEPSLTTMESMPAQRSSISSQPWIPEEMVSHLPPGLHLLIRFHPSTERERPVCWITADTNMLQHRAMTAVEHCVTAADMTTVLAARMRLTQECIEQPGVVMGLMNTNTTAHFARQPIGEWYGFTDHFISISDGYGVAECTLFDKEGCIGRVVQSLIVND